MKKFFALVLAVVLMSVSFAAFAAGSKTTNDVATVTPVEEKPALVVKVVEANEAVEALIAKLTEGDAEVLPEDADGLELTEVLQVVASGVEEGVGSVTVLLSTTTVFAPEKSVKVFMGVTDGENVTWEEIAPVTVNEDGALLMTVTEDQLMTMQNQPNVVLAIFVNAE